MTAPTDPYVAVIFSNLHTGTDPDGYATTAARMEELAASQPGFLGIESVRGEDGSGITVSYWRSEEDARAWKRHGEHLLAQETGRTSWYRRYRVRVATVTREYAFDAGVPDGAGEPDLIFHLALPADWVAATESGWYRVSTRGRSLDDEGFIHCSTRQQLVGVAERFYGDVGEVVILHVDPDRLGAEVRVEPAVEGGGELFPHVYGPIPSSAVVGTTRWARGAGSSWPEPPGL